MAYLQTMTCPNDCNTYFYKIDLCCMYYDKKGKLLVYDAFTPTDNSPDRLNIMRDVIDRHHKEYRCCQCHAPALVKFYVKEGA